MTTLRNSQLLNAHALIIAEKVNVKDMSEYYGLISFVNIGQVQLLLLISIVSSS
jgi:hypothetical protein